MHQGDENDKLFVCSEGSCKELPHEYRNNVRVIVALRAVKTYILKNQEGGKGEKRTRRA